MSVNHTNINWNMDPNTNVKDFLKEIQILGNQIPTRIRHRHELFNDLINCFRKNTKFTVYSGSKSFDILVRFNNKIFVHVENVDNMRYGMLLTFNSFDISCHKVKMVIVNIKNRMEIDLHINKVNPKYILSNIDEVYDVLMSVYDKVIKYLIGKYKLRINHGDLYQILDDGKSKYITLDKSS